MKRRTFLQFTGMAAAGGVLSGCRQGNEKLIPFLVPPDEGVVPGVANYYASACNGCGSGCGILVRIAEGRAKKIEGNPKHPVNRGKLCARGQALLQELYHPDRIAQPLKRTGPRGSGEFSPISWKEGLDLLVGRLKDLQSRQVADSLAFLSPPLRGTLAEMVTRFLGAFGSPNHFSHEPMDTHWLRLVSQETYGRAALPYYDIEDGRYLLSFGADFIENHLSPVHYGRAFGRMRQGRITIRGYFTYVGGRMSVTGASADRWLPARPGSEGALALGMARLILDEKLYDPAAISGKEAAELAAHLADYDLISVAGKTDLPPTAIAEVAREFSATRPALAMVGEAVASQSNGLASARAVQLLNLLVGSLNRPGGIYPDAGPAPAPGSGEDLPTLIEAMRQGRIQTALLYDCNPVYTLSPATGFQEALGRVPFIVSFASLLDDTGLQADLILPNHTPLERWGDVIPAAGARNPVVGLMQPVVRPVFDTRPFPDLLLTLAGELGGKLAATLPQESYLALLKESIRGRTGLPSGRDFEKAWIALLQEGGLFSAEKSPDTFPVESGKTISLPRLAEPSFAGDDKKYPLHLQIYPSAGPGAEKGAALPWLQQMPDPMTTVVWGSWLEINPETAENLGIDFGDLVEVSSPRGSLQLPAVIYPGIRPDLVAIPLGQGHRGMGRYADGRGVNPLSLLAMTGEETVPPWNATRVQVRRVSRHGDLVTAGNPEGSYRGELISI
jgi:anaerobic selenocysteine-containing dehydrogenase